MKEFMKNYSLGAIACFVMGVALIVNPHIITDVLNTAIGVLLILWAAFGIVRFLISCASGRQRESVFMLASNIVLLAAGIYVFVNTKLLETVVMIALGLYLLCSGIPSLADSIRIKGSLNSSGWILTFVTSLLTAVLGVIILFSPLKVSSAFMRFVGILLALAGIVNFISGFSASKFYKDIEKRTEDVKYRKGKMKDKTADDKSKAIDIDID